MIAGAAYGIAVVTAGTVLLLVKRLCTPSAEADSSSDGSGGSGGSGGRIVRRMSFSSSVMANGVFPPQAKVWKTVINTAMFFDQCPSLDLVVERASTLLRYDRFRCCLVQERGRLVLREIAKLDPARDIIRTVQVSSDAELAQAVDRLCNEELVTGDGLPLWGMVRLQNSGGRSALLTRLHHCIGDGIALIGCLNDIFQDEQGGPLDLSIGRSMSGGSSSRFSLSSLMNFLKSALKVLLLPLTRYDSDLAFSPRDRARLDMAGQTRLTVRMPTLRLAFVKALKNKAGVTVNDVMLALTGGMVRRYCQRLQDPLFAAAAGGSQASARVLMAVAFPRPQEETEDATRAMRNKFAMVSVGLPLGQGACERLRQCAASTRELKSSPVALLQLMVQNHVLSCAPEFLQQKTAHDVFSRHTMVFSNLPGPEQLITFGGHVVTDIQVIFPNLIPQALMISYAGGVCFNISLDPDVVKEHALLPELLLAECRELAGELGVDAGDADMLCK